MQTYGMMVNLTAEREARDRVSFGRQSLRRTYVIAYDPQFAVAPRQIELVVRNVRQSEIGSAAVVV
jgi:hypothetical protein